GQATAKLLQGHRVLCPNVKTSPITIGDPSGFLQLDIQSFVSIPLVKNFNLVAAFNVHQTEPRKWAAHEIELIEETAERTWSAVARARAEAALRKSETLLRQTTVRLESAMAAGLAGTFFWDIIQNKLITDENMRQYFSLSEKALTEGVPLSEAMQAI